jgi:hypothetical protein
MSRRMIVTAVLLGALAIPVVSRAHGGHTHKVMGTVSAVSPTQLEVKTTDGKTAIVSVNAKTVYQQGKAKVDLKTLKVGDRVVVEGTQANGAKAITAQTVQVGTTAAAPAKK